MKIGLALPHYGYSLPGGRDGASWNELSAWARQAEDLGYHSIWISDHFFLSLARYGGRDEPFGSPDPLTALAGLAVVTRRVRLGTLVLGTSFRHPGLLAKAATTVDLLSEGRLDLGLGAGWYEAEYEAFGYPFGGPGERFDVLEETLEVLGRLFGEGPAEWSGKHFSLDGAYNRPRPAQSPRPPLIVGGKGGPRLLRLVARLADGWNTVWAWSPEAYAEKGAALDAACERVGRDPATVRRSVGLYALVGEDARDVEVRHERLLDAVPGGPPADADLDAWRGDRLVGTPEEILERLAAFAELGVEEMILCPAAVPFAVHDEQMVELIAERVIPEARDL